MIAGLRKAIERLSGISRVRWWMLLIAVALGPRLIWAVAMRDRSPRFDEVGYTTHAVGLMDGRGYVDSNGWATAYWPVGYPVALAGAYRVLGPGTRSGVMLQVLLGVAGCFLLSILGSAAFGPGIGRAGALALAAYPNHIAYSTLQLSEPLSVFLLLAAVLLIIRTDRLSVIAAAGLLLGLVALVRPMLILLPLALGFWFWRIVPGGAVAVVRTAVLGVFTLIAVSPWVIRNHSVNGRWTTLSTSGGDAFWVGNHPAAFGGYKHHPSVREMLQVGDRRDYDKGYRLGLDAIRDAPLQAGVRAMKKLTHFVALETDGVLWNLKGLDQTAPRWLQLVLLGIVNAGYVAVAVLSILGLLRAPPRDPLATMFFVLLAYLSFMSAVFLGDPRYHYALIPFACLFAAYGIVNFPPRTARAGAVNSGSRIWARWAVCTGLFAVMLLANVAIKFAEIRALGP